MKLAFFNDYQLGVINGNQIVDVASAVGGISYHSPQELIEMLIQDWENLQPQIAQAAEGDAGAALDSVRLRAPPAETESIGLSCGQLHRTCCPRSGRI